MSEEADEQDTVLGRRLMRSDLKEIRDIVQEISQRQLEFLDNIAGLERRLRATDARVKAMERTRWAPAVACTVILLLTVAARLL